MITQKSKILHIEKIPFIMRLNHIQVPFDLCGELQTTIKMN